MKKINVSYIIYLLIILCSLMVISISSFFSNDTFNIVAALVFIIVFSSVLFLTLYQLIFKYASKNYIFSKNKMYIFLFVIFSEYYVIKYGYELLIKFCEWSFSWTLKWKIIILVSICFIIIINIYSVVNVIKNNERVKDKIISLDDLKKDFKANEEVTNKLDYYYDNKNIDGAVFLNGSWGSGKTYYIEKYVDFFNSNKKERAVYVSLNGLKSVDEVNNALLAALHPVLSATKKSPILKVLSCATKYTTDILSINYDSLSEINFDISKFDANLIVFDDIERCQVEIPVLFGYIDLIKKSCSKIILVADEKELLNYLFPEEAYHNKAVSSNVLIANNCSKAEETGETKNKDKKDIITSILNEKNDSKYSGIVRELEEIEKNIYPKKYYEIIKEKVVWDTIPFVFDINILFDTIINYSEYENIKEIVINNKNIIMKIEDMFKCRNLRTYKCALDVLKYLHNENIFDSYSHKEEIERKVLVNVFALMINYKHPSKFGIDFPIRIDGEEYEKLVSFSEYNNGIYVDIEELESELSLKENELSEIDEDKVPIYILELKETWVYKTDEDLTNNINELLNAYNDNKLDIKYFILCYHYLYSYIEEFGFELKDVKLDDVKNELIERINSSNKYVDLEDFHFMLDNFYENEIGDIKEIYHTLESMNQRYESKEIVKESLNISNLPLDRIKKISEQAIGRKAFLSLFSVNDLMDYIKKADNEGVAYFRLLIHQVYEFSNLSDFFEADKQTIQDFIGKLKEYNKDCESKTKKKLIEWFIDNLKEILGRL